jgi:predicted regulator of Ras-like GTPase activity (Roadblock/LC7/MglB family)
MSQTTIDQLNVLLADLTARVDCIRGIVISSADGLKIADRFRDHLPPSDRIVIYTGEGIVTVFNLGNASLLALLDPDANVGLVMIELQHAAEKVKKVMRL